MSDGVKFIFKTLLKVPCIIFAAFFVFNVFAFFFIYFKVLGLSYVVMQEVVENNYITDAQYSAGGGLRDYFNTIDNIPMAANTNLIVGVDTNNEPVYLDVANNLHNANTGATAALANTYRSARSRVQYGQARCVGVHCDYTIIWPLSYNQAQGLNNGVNGGASNPLYNSIQTHYNSANDPYTNNAPAGATYSRGHYISIPLNIFYVVPGLKYYADL